MTLDSIGKRVATYLPARTARVGVSGAITGVGLVLSGVLIARLFVGFASPLGLFFGGLVPLVIAVAVAVAGLLIWRCRLTAEQSVHVWFWWVVGTAAAAATGFALVLFQASGGVTVADPELIVIGNSASGGLGGVIVGWYDARRLAVAAERERERQQLADEREKLAMINRIVRHDIGNDLQVIAGMADALERHVDEDGADPLERLQRTTSEAIDLTERVRTFASALENDEGDLRPVALQHVLTTQVENFRDRYPAVTISLPEPVPDVAVQADELLATVLHNLLSNAVTHNDSDDPHVIVTVETDSETATVRVADNGPGIPDTQRDSLFERGELGPHSDGSGIGLYIVDQLIEYYDGSITVGDSDIGGAAFEARLPRAD